MVRAWDRLRPMDVPGYALEHTKHLLGMGPVSLVPSWFGKGTLLSTNLGRGSPTMWCIGEAGRWVIPWPKSHVPETVELDPESRTVGNRLVGAYSTLFWFQLSFWSMYSSVCLGSPCKVIKSIRIVCLSQFTWDYLSIQSIFQYWWNWESIWTYA